MVIYQTRCLVCSGTSRLQEASGIVYGHYDGTACTLIESIQNVHILVFQIKTINICVRSNALWSVAFWQTNPAFLDTPPDQDLVWCDAMLLSNGDKVLVLRFLISHYWAISLNNNVLLLAI